MLPGLFFDENFPGFLRSWGTPALVACGMELIFLSLTGLLAIWGGLGRLHWFVRAAVVLGVLSLWLVVPAYEPLLVFFTQTVLAAIVLAWARYRRAWTDGGPPRPASPRRRPQFFLRDLLLWTVIVAAVSAGATRVTTDVWEDWWKYVPFGVAYGLLTVLAAWVALGRARWWLRAAVGCLAFPSLLMAGWIILARRSGFLGGEPSSRVALRYAARASVVAVSLLIVSPSVFVYHELITPMPIPPAELPEPNGYAELMRAASGFRNLTIPERADGTGVLRSFVQQHADTLEIARNGLDGNCKVPLRYEMTDLDSVIFSKLRTVARVFVAEAALAEEEGRTDDAMRIHCDQLRLGNATARGGLLVDRLVGLVIKGIGVSSLRDLKDRLSPQQCRELIEVLQASDATWEPLDDCMTRDQAWEDHVFRWQGRVAGIVERFPRLTEADRDKPFEVSDFRHEARRNLLVTQLAIRCHRLERSELPNTLADLVPDYLPAVPEDPFSGESLIYRQEGDHYVLYSVGEDRKDDGGHRISPEGVSSDDEDLFLDKWVDEE